MHDLLSRFHLALVRLSVVLPCVVLSGCGGWGDAVQEVVLDGGGASCVVSAVNPWTVRSEETLAIVLAQAQAEAARVDRRVLLVFIGFRDPDSEAVVRVLRAAPAQTVLVQRYVPVYVNVGRDGVGHTRLRHAHDVRKLATFVVLDASGHRVARQTFSPVSDERTLSSGKLAEWLISPHGR